VKFEFDTEPTFIADAIARIARSRQAAPWPPSSACPSTFYSSNLESFPEMVFVTIGSLDNPDRIEPRLEMFTKGRLKMDKAARRTAICKHASLSGAVNSSNGQRYVFFVARPSASAFKPSA
jgi:hypothetical protein